MWMLLFSRRLAERLQLLFDYLVEYGSQARLNPIHFC
jgi:hypothetical protein